MRVTFLGVSTLLIDDGETALLTDGFFSRPSLLRMLAGPVRPNLVRIQQGLRDAGINRLAAVLVAHSHYDHAMDSPVVARLTGAVLVGSRSTGQIAAGYGFPPEQFTSAEQTLHYGQFTVTAVPSVHAPGDRFPGAIEAPVTLPARIGAYRTGDCYSFHLGHPAGSLLVHASANFIPDALEHLRADVVYLGIGELGKQSDSFRRDYWQHVVAAVQPRRLVPIHWDDFTRGLDRPLRMIPQPIEKHQRTLTFLADACRANNIDLQLPSCAEPNDPFA